MIKPDSHKDWWAIIAVVIAFTAILTAFSEQPGAQP
jgi:hypothetical protein